MSETAELVYFGTERCRKYLIQAANGFLNDPPDSAYQRGYLAAICDIWKEAIGGRSEDDARLIAAQKILMVPPVSE